jgi:hypothetical protein
MTVTTETMWKVTIRYPQSTQVKQSLNTAEVKESESGYDKPSVWVQ